MFSQKEKWVKELPYSRMTYPATIPNRVKYWFWRIYTPLHPLLRDTTTWIGIVQHKRRQNFLVGELHLERPIQDFAMFLVEQGFGNHFVAWKDPNEILSLRRIHGFKYQYHIRVFSDREVRCHYEYTPEYRPIHHM